MPTNTWRAESSRKKALNRLQQAHRVARTAGAVQAQVQAIERTRDEHNKRGQKWTGSALTHYSLLLLLPAVYALDLPLSAPALEYIAQGSSTGGLPTLLLPLPFLFMHVALGSLIAKAREGINASEAYLWIGAGIAFNLAITALVGTTQLAAMSASSLPEDIKTVLLVSICLLSFVAHGSILWMGKALLDAKNFLAHQLQSLRLDRKASRLAQRSERLQSRVMDQFQRFMNARDRHERRHPDVPLPNGPYEQALREIVNKRCGQEIIPAPREGAVGSKPSERPIPAEAGMDDPFGSEDPFANAAREADAQLNFADA